MQALAIQFPCPSRTAAPALRQRGSWRMTRRVDQPGFQSVKTTARTERAACMTDTNDQSARPTELTGCHPGKAGRT